MKHLNNNFNTFQNYSNLHSSNYWVYNIVINHSVLLYKNMYFDSFFYKNYIVESNKITKYKIFKTNNTIFLSNLRVGHLWKKNDKSLWLKNTELLLNKSEYVNSNCKIEKKTFTKFNELTKINQYYWHLKLEKSKTFLYTLQTNFKNNNISTNKLNYNSAYSLINIHFLKKEALYTKLKYSRTPAYDIVSGGSAALLAAFLGFLITEKFGFELLDSGDFYYLFMYCVFIALVLKSIVKFIEPLDGWYNHLNPKYFLKYIIFLLQAIFNFFIKK